MEKRDELRFKLDNFYESVKTLENAENRMNNIKLTLKNLYESNYVKKFDNEHKEKYIIALIGEKPNKPLIFGKKKFEEALENWNISYEEAEKKYFNEYENERNQLKIKQEILIKERNKSLNDLLDEIKNEKEKVDKYDLKIGEIFKSSSNIKTLIEIIQTHRADTLKEALFLFYDDLHKRKIEEELHRQTAHIKDLEQLSENAIKKSEEAFNQANIAISKAEEAINIADNAYSVARNAEQN